MTKLFRSAALALSMTFCAVPALAKDDGGKPAAVQKHAAASMDAKFDRWILTPHGKIDGMLLDGGRVVMVHEKSVRDTSLKAGDAVHVEAKGKGTTFHRAKVTKNGVVVVDDTGKPEKGAHEKGGAKLGDVNGTGKVVALIQGHKGKVHGVVLEGGITAYGGKKADLGAMNLKIGDSVTVAGKGGSYALGRALVIDTIKKN